MIGAGYTSYTFYQEITGAIMSTTVKPSADAAAIHNTREAVRSQPGLGNLTFQMIFYCNVDLVVSHNAVRSEVRFKLDSKFREMGIEMAFPQRDLHLKVKDSLNVKVLS